MDDVLEWYGWAGVPSKDGGIGFEDASGRNVEELGRKKDKVEDRLRLDNPDDDRNKHEHQLWHARSQLFQKQSVYVWLKKERKT